MFPTPQGLPYETVNLGPPKPPCNDERIATVHALNPADAGPDPQIGAYHTDPPVLMAHMADWHLHANAQPYVEAMAASCITDLSSSVCCAVCVMWVSLHAHLRFAKHSSYVCPHVQCSRTPMILRGCCFVMAACCPGTRHVELPGHRLQCIMAMALVVLGLSCAVIVQELGVP